MRQGSASTTTDAIVIGAGVIGCVIALCLCRRGMTVRVVERDRAGSGASSRGFGLIWVQSKAPEAYLELSLASASTYRQLLESLGDDCGYLASGGMILIKSPEQAERMESLFARQRRVPGFTAQLLPIAEARRLEPAIADDLWGASYSPHDAQIEPRRLLDALVRAARAEGVVLDEDAAVMRQEQHGPTWTVTTQRGRFEAPVVVNCAGMAAPAIARMIGADLPVTVVRGQIAVSAPQRPLLRHATVDVRQGADGRIWMGTIYQPGQDSLEVRAEDTSTIRANVVQQIPALAQVPIAEVWAGLRPMPGDGLPLLGALPGIEGQYVAVAHSGITLCPIVGQLMAEVITSGRPVRSLDAFHPGRTITAPPRSFDLATPSTPPQAQL